MLLRRGGILIKYFMVGGVCALVDWSAFAWLSFGMHLHYLVAATISFAIATLLNYVLSVRFVFESGARFGKTTEVAAVFAVSGVGMLINHLALALAVAMLSAPLMLGKCAATGLVFFWNFLLRKYFVFKPVDGTPDADPSPR